MPTQKLESAGLAVAVWTSFCAMLGSAVDWLTADATRTGLLIAFGGLLIQAGSAWHNRALRQADERRKEAEDRRKEEEHQLKMAILRSELTEDRLTRVETVDG